MDCLFCKIVNHEINSDVAYEDDKIIAFKDINPMAPVHVLVVPKIHIESLNDVNDKNSEYIKYLFEKINEIAELLGIKESGFRTILNTGADAGQTVKHLHAHILGGKRLPDQMV